MRIVVNNKDMEVLPVFSVKDLTVELQLPEQGVAVAVNNKMIPRAEWSGFLLKEADHVVLVKAACGG